MFLYEKFSASLRLCCEKSLKNYEYFLHYILNKWGAIMRSEKGFTLLNLVIVIVVMSVAAAVAIELLSVSEAERMRMLTIERMQEVAEAIYGDTDKIPQTDFGYVADIGALPNTLDDLINDTGDPNWNGPYLVSDFDDTNPADLVEDANGSEFEYDPITGIISTAEGSPIDIVQDPVFTPDEILNSSLWGKITDIGDQDGNIHIPLQSDLENIYISLIYVTNDNVTGVVEEEKKKHRKKGRKHTFWKKWDIKKDDKYKWNWKEHSKSWWGGKDGHWWNEEKKPWWTKDKEYKSLSKGWKKWYQTNSDHNWWQNLISEYPEQKKWAFWWWWRHRGRHRPDPTVDTEAAGRFITIHPDADGTYRFSDIPIGNYTVEASHDLLGIALEKPVAILPNIPNRADFRFNLIFPGYPGYGEDTGGEDESGLRVNYHDLIINGYSDNDIRLANGKTEEEGEIKIDKIKVSWSNPDSKDKINKIEIDDKQRWSSGWGWGGGEKSGSIINISDYKIKPQESGKVLELFFNKNLNPKELQLVFILKDGSEVIVPPDYGGGENPVEEATLLSIDYPDLAINGNFDQDINIGNSSETANITLDKIKLSWSNSRSSQRVEKVKINDEIKWQSFSGEKSGNILNLNDIIIPPSTDGITVRFEFNRNISNSNMSLEFTMGDNTVKTIQ